MTDVVAPVASAPRAILAMPWACARLAPARQTAQERSVGVTGVEALAAPALAVIPVMPQAIA